jgi:hypothetical protein
MRKRGLPGPIFQGRPKSILIVGEEYLKTVARYILRNPVKAGLSENLNYKWSSYKFLNKNKIPDWYDNSVILSGFNKNKLKAIKEYKEFIRKPLKADDKEYPLEKFAGIAGCNKKLYEKILKKVKKDKRKANKTYTRKIDWNKRIEKILKKSGKTINELQKTKIKNNVEIKRKIAYIMHELMLCESKEISEYLGISQSTLSSYIINIKERIQKNELKVGNL